MDVKGCLQRPASTAAAADSPPPPPPALSDALLVSTKTGSHGLSATTDGDYPIVGGCSQDPGSRLAAVIMPPRSSSGSRYRPSSADAPQSANAFRPPSRGEDARRRRYAALAAGAAPHRSGRCAPAARDADSRRRASSPPPRPPARGYFRGPGRRSPTFALGACRVPVLGWGRRGRPLRATESHSRLRERMHAKISCGWEKAGLPTSLSLGSAIAGAQGQGEVGQQVVGTRRFATGA